MIAILLVIIFGILLASMGAAIGYMLGMMAFDEFKI